MRAGVFRQVSRDHTSAQTLIDAGILTREEAEHHISRHQLSQYLGIFPEEMVIQPFIETVVLSPGDRMLLCSDGLTDGLDNSAIEGILQKNQSPVLAIEYLYENALDNGAKDNITIILVQVGDD